MEPCVSGKNGKGVQETEQNLEYKWEKAGDEDWANISLSRFSQYHKWLIIIAVDNWLWWGVELCDFGTLWQGGIKVQQFVCFWTSLLYYILE
jgi:hypothetical protein